MLLMNPPSPPLCPSCMHAGADPYLADERGGLTCVHHAAKAGHADVLDAIVDFANQSMDLRMLHADRRYGTRACASMRLAECT